MPREKKKRYTLDGDEVDLELLIEANQHRLTPELIDKIFALRPGESLVLWDDSRTFR